MASNLKIGVLALQGAFSKHLEMLTKLGVLGVPIRRPEELLSCDGLILPGGESTTMNTLLSPFDLPAFPGPILGTCAGLILLSQNNLINVSIERNGYGRQIASFTAELDSGIEAVFIRAPRITSINSPDVQTLATYNGEPVWVQQGRYMGCSFHPELTNSLTIHQNYIGVCAKWKAKQSTLQQ